MSDNITGIPTAHFALLLEQAGWRRLQTDYFATQQWIHYRTGRDLLLPNSETAGGAERLLLRAVEALAATSSKSTATVTNDLRLAGSDVVRFRRPTPEGVHTIPLSDGRSVLDSALKLMSAAAASAVTARAVLPSRRPRQALDYIERRLRLGHSETGSYVVTVISDVEALNTPGEPGLVEYWETPFPRRVIRTLYTALNFSKVAAPTIARGERDAIEPAVERGVSADLLDAMAGLIGAAQEEDGIGVGVRWAPVFPEEREGPEEDLWFNRDEGRLFSEAARIIKESDPLEGIAVTGVVEGLHREEGEPDGTATIACIIDGTPRKLHARLAEEDYELAVAAHLDTRVVVFRTDVQRRGNRFHGNQVRGFRLTDD